MNGNLFAHLGGHLGQELTATVSAVFSAAIDCNRSMHIFKSGSFWTPSNRALYRSKSENA